MPKFVIERGIPGAGKMSDQELRDAALRSLQTLDGMGPKIQWSPRAIGAKTTGRSVRHGLKSNVDILGYC